MPIIASALLGVIFGSFLATVIIRWPDLRSVVTGRSHCDHCGTELAAVRLIPLMSYFGQQGRSACCGRSINALYPTAEALGMIVGALSFSLLEWDGYAGALVDDAPSIAGTKQLDRPA